MQTISTMTLRRIKGFTIVELLIVIVVIGILAAITILSYNGITAKAQTSKTVSAVRQYVTIFTQYKSTYGHYPDLAGNAACLGANFPASSPYPVSECEMHGAGRGTDVNDYNTLTTELKKVSPNLPDSSYPSLRTDFGAASPFSSRGVSFGSDTNTIYYYLKGNTKCPIGNASFISYSGVTQCTVDLA